ncbi:hypothetical protein CQW23_11959 [Capsicum baccatum]|uniref:Uncharacterized protein n=1 Tax=Capsicum baccatum TaxID=33114 RepID=A0A2G2WRD3_CAPBA|nr:hypothetical protein CQW23_11959 [Capsicum baccatum]
METVSIRKTVLLVQIWFMLNASPHIAHCQFPAFSKLQLSLRTIGPESAAFDRKGGGPYTDNIKRTVLGDFWVAIANTKQHATFSIGQRINQLGEVVETRDFTDQYNSPNGISEVQEHNDKLYVGSLDQNFIGVFRV